MATILANQNRDPKKGKGPVYTDFCFYKPVQEGNQPNYVYGSAYMELIKQDRLPTWALSFFTAMKDSSNAEYVPADVALVASDAILLHPVHEGSGRYSGLLLAAESASMQARESKNDQGQVITLTLPNIPTKFIAEEGVTLTP